MPVKHHIHFFGLSRKKQQLMEQALGGMQNVTIHEEPLTLDNCPANATILGVFVNSAVTKAHLKKMPKLKHICTLSTGFDHLDIPALKKKKITAHHVPDYGMNTVAEHALMLMLITLKQLPQTLRQQQTFGGALGRELQGKTIGIMGTGRIGKRLIELLASWDVEIIAWDAYPDKTFAAEHGITYVSKTKLLATSDIISLHLPLFSNTRHIINRAAIKRMKKGAILINTARGELVDSVALLDAIKTEHLAGAGLDVLDQEDFSPHSPLISTYKKLDQAKTAIANARLKQHEHVIVTPHCAFHTEEAIARIISQTVATITALCQGESIPSLTDSI